MMTLCTFKLCCGNTAAEGHLLSSFEKPRWLLYTRRRLAPSYLLLCNNDVLWATSSGALTSSWACPSLMQPKAIEENNLSPLQLWELHMSCWSVYTDSKQSEFSSSYVVYTWAVEHCLYVDWTLQSAGTDGYSLAATMRREASNRYPQIYGFSGQPIAASI